MYKILLLIALFTFNLFAQKILIINSNKNIEKYAQLENEFVKDFDNKVSTLDINDMKVNEIKEYLYDEYPDIVYAIGSKAYQIAHRFIPEKEIFFSGIVNYKRLDVDSNKFGVANEVYPGMKITLSSSLFNDLKKIHIIYSDYTQELFNEYKKTAALMDIKIVGQNITYDDEINFQEILKADGFILLSDPLLLEEKDDLLSLLKTLNDNNKIIIAYHELFIQYGATLVVKVDEPTIARQISSMISQKLTDKSFEHIQNPMGTNIIFNKKLADDKNISYNNSNMFLMNKVIE